MTTDEGRGVGGTGRRGRPKSDEERRETHKESHGTEDLPPRGSGLRRRR